MAVGDPAAEAHAGSMFVLENVERPAVQPTPSTTSPRALVDWYARECPSHLPAVPHDVVCAVAVGMGAARELFLTLVRGAATRLDEVVPVRVEDPVVRLVRGVCTACRWRSAGGCPCFVTRVMSHDAGPRSMACFRAPGRW